MTQQRDTRRPWSQQDPGVLAIWLLMGAFVVGTSLAVVASTLNVMADAPVRTAVPRAIAAATPATANASATPAPTAPTQAAGGRAVTVPDIARRTSAIPARITRDTAQTVTVNLEAREVTAALDDGQTYTYWTFDGAVPGPFVRIRVGDTVDLHLRNATGDTLTHSIDLHAVNGPGGGSGATQVAPGAETSFTFKALNPGLYVYHCATAPIPLHVTNGMYGLILVEPAGGLPPVDREFYVMQAELYTTTAYGTPGHHDVSTTKMLAEQPDYVLFNGRVGALTGENALRAKVGERIRIFFGVGGFLTSSFHVIGEIFDRVYPEGAVGSEPLQNVQTTLVPAGGATIVELTINVPGRYLLVDHSLPRALNKGAVGYLEVEGSEDHSIFNGTGGAGH